MEDVRDYIIKQLEKEIIGPSDNPEYKDPVTGEEVLLRVVHGPPHKRYGAGMLFPQQTREERDIPDNDGKKEEVGEALEFESR